MDEPKSDAKVAPPPPPPTPTAEPKWVRPKRRYTKKKDRLKGILVSKEPVTVRFD